MKSLWLIYPFCSLFILVGVALCVITLRGIRKGRTVSRWPTTNARVVDCDLESKSGSKGGRLYEVTVNYRYSVNGREYSGTQIHPAYSSSNLDGHRALYKKLKSAEVVEVRYNEASPGESYLLKGTFNAHWATFFGGMIFASAGLFFLLTFHFAIVGNSDYAAALTVVR